MAFLEKVDYFSLSSDTVVPVSDSDGKSASVVEAMNEAGQYVARDVFGEKYAPSNEYVIKGTLTLTVTLGTVSSTSKGSIVLTNFAIATGVGSAPKITAGGQSVEANGVTNCTFATPSLSVSSLHHALILDSAFTLSGTGCYLQSANYSATCNCTTAEKEGVVLAHDVTGGKFEVDVSIIQTGTTTPTITAGSDYVITSPLACSNPDSNYPTWTCKLTKYLIKS